MKNKEIINLPPLYLNTIAAKIPKWDMNSLIHRRCPICNEDDNFTFCIRPDTLQVVKCKNCGMIYVKDIPSDKDLINFYKSYSEYKEYKNNHEPKKLTYARKLLHRIIYKDLHILILEKTGGIRGKKICEIGCSFGNFLFEIKRMGANAIGVELDTRAVKFLREKGITCYEEIPQSEKFDIICAFQLVEHLAHPGVFFNKVTQSLVSGGRLLLSLPNGNEIEKVGPSWIGFRVDMEHINYFSIKSLANLLIQHGFYIEHYYEYNQPNIFIKGKQFFFKRLTQIPKNIFLKISSLPLYTDGSFVLTVLARKY